MMAADNDYSISSLESMSDRDFDRFSAFIYGNFGIKMPPHKKTMLEGRLRKRLKALGLKTFAEYRDYFFSADGMSSELVEFCNAVTTNKTDFFREPAHFDFLKELAVPELLAAQGGSGHLKFWSAACSSGQEPYTMAMVLADLAEQIPGFTFDILGTDLSQEMIEKGRLGIYEFAKIEPVSQEMRRKYLLKNKDKEHPVVRIAPELRAKVRFQRLNLMDERYQVDRPIDVIFCRNVIIYFDRPTQQKLVGRLITHLPVGGYLFMGHSETLNGMGLPIRQVAPSVYVRTH